MLILFIFILFALLGFIMYCTTIKMIEKQYHKFTVHPVIPLYNSLLNSRDFTKIQTIAAVIAYSVFYLALTPFWALAWCLWKGVKYMVSQFIDNSMPNPKWDSDTTKYHSKTILENNCNNDISFDTDIEDIEKETSIDTNNIIDLENLQNQDLSYNT